MGGGCYYWSLAQQTQFFNMNAAGYAALEGNNWFSPIFSYHNDVNGYVVGDDPGEMLCSPGMPCMWWNPNAQLWGTLGEVDVYPPYAQGVFQGHPRLFNAAAGTVELAAVPYAIGAGALCVGSTVCTAGAAFGSVLYVENYGLMNPDVVQELELVPVDAGHVPGEPGDWSIPEPPAIPGSAPPPVP